MPLYFIAIVPHEALKEEIRDMKEEMKVRFNASHALKSPAHITLQMPFKRGREDELKIAGALEHFAKEQSGFSVALTGFDHFSNRVIYVKVENPQPVQILHKWLDKVLRHQLNFQEDEINPKLHPHMTIATRDLSKLAFKHAWPEFQQRNFHASFHVRSIFLLKHNGKYWDIYEEFAFTG